MRSGRSAVSLVAARAASAVVVAAVTLAGVACSATPSTSTAPTSAPGTAPRSSVTPGTKSEAPSTIYANVPAKPVRASVGQTVALRVDTDPGSEAGWEVLRYDEGKLFNLGAGYDEGVTAVPGRPVTQNLLFRATAPGTATVVLRYGTPGSAAPTDSTVTFTVDIS